MPLKVTRRGRKLYCTLKCLFVSSIKCKECLLIFWLISFTIFLCILTDYAALLSRHSSLTHTTSTAIATGRFYFRKKALTYSFVTSPDFGFPTTLTFLDEDSNIIEEFPLRPTLFQVCRHILSYSSNLIWSIIIIIQWRHEWLRKLSFSSSFRMKQRKFAALGNVYLGGTDDNFAKINCTHSWQTNRVMSLAGKCQSIMVLVLNCFHR